MSDRPRIRRRIYVVDKKDGTGQLAQLVGELARDADEALQNQGADLDSLLERIASLEARVTAGGL